MLPIAARGVGHMYSVPIRRISTRPSRSARLGTAIAGVLTAALLVAGSPSACAGGLAEEVRFGVYDQNIEPAGHSYENGLAINGEVLFSRIFAPSGSQLADAVLGFRPVIGGTYSMQRDTDKLYAGLSWTIPLVAGLFVESNLGAALHDGALDDPNGAHYGCHVNFWESVSAGYDIDAHWRLLLTADHFSNADLCAANRGLTQGGVRLGYRLN